MEDITTLGDLVKWVGAVAAPAVYALFNRIRKLETDMALKADKEKVQTQLDTHIQRVEQKLDRLTDLLIEDLRGSQMRVARNPDVRL